jgi:hypothetical protein
MDDAKKVLMQGTLFFLPIFIIVGYLEFQLRHKPFVSSYASKKHFMEQQLDSIETLVLGSSQTFNGINPAGFKTKTFNLGNVSQTLFYDEQLTIKYLPKLPKLKTVLINISYFSFFYQLSDIKENWRDYYYLNHYGIKFLEIKDFTTNNFSFLAVYQPLHSIKLCSNNFTDKDALQISENGYQPKFEQEEISDSTGRERVTVHNAENYPKRRKEIEEGLKEFVGILAEKNIQVVFFTTPVFKTYSKYCDKSILMKNTEFVEQLCSTYKCRYVNFFTDKRFLKDDFFDNDHLKNNGANKLSKFISDSLNL